MMTVYGAYYGGLGGYAKRDLGQAGWAEWYRYAAEGLW